MQKSKIPLSEWLAAVKDGRHPAGQKIPSIEFMTCPQSVSIPSKKYKIRAEYAGTMPKSTAGAEEAYTIERSSILFQRIYKNKHVIFEKLSVFAGPDRMAQAMSDHQVWVSSYNLAKIRKYMEKLIRSDLLHRYEHHWMGYCDQHQCQPDSRLAQDMRLYLSGTSKELPTGLPEEIKADFQAISLPPEYQEWFFSQLLELEGPITGQIQDVYHRSCTKNVRELGYTQQFAGDLLRTAGYAEGLAVARWVIDALADAQDFYPEDKISPRIAAHSVKAVLAGLEQQRLASSEAAKVLNTLGFESSVFLELAKVRPGIWIKFLRMAIMCLDNLIVSYASTSEQKRA